ncbi:hypothetical protein [Nitratifractor sp.]
MKKTLFVLFVVVYSLVSTTADAATRAEVNILEATENIRFISQRLTKNYLYLFANPLKIEIKKQLRLDLNELVDNIRSISLSTNDEDTKNILEFLTYSKNQIEALISKKPSKENAALMLDYSETLLEGANSIAKAHQYTFTPSEKMLILSKKLNFLVERAAKYYMALGIGLGTDINHQQMNEAIRNFDADLKTLEAYEYPVKLQKKRDQLLRFWKVTKGFFPRLDKVFASNIMWLSTDKLERLTENFVIYHRKHQ